MNVDVRPMRHSDVPAASALSQAAYGHPLDERDVRLYLDLDPKGWLVATVAGRIVGMGGVSVFGDQAVIGLMATHPDHQRQGVGSAVFTWLVSYAEARGAGRMALYATELGAALYRRHGFAELELTDTWENSTAPRAGELTPEVLPAPADTGAEPLSSRDVDQIVALDAEAFGASRERLIARLVAELPGRCFGIRDEAGRLRAHVIAQRQRIGPAVAGSDRDAALLLETALSLPFQEPPRILVPRAHPTAAALLQRRGFTAPRFTRYMLRGTAVSPGRRSLILGLANYSVG